MMSASRFPRNQRGTPRGSASLERPSPAERGSRRRASIAPDMEPCGRPRRPGQHMKRRASRKVASENAAGADVGSPRTDVDEKRIAGHRCVARSQARLD